MSRLLKFCYMTALTIALSYLCFILPPWFSDWTDQKVIGTVKLEALQEAKVEISKQMTILEKINLLNNQDISTGISINQGKYLTKEEALTTLQNEMKELIKSGIIKENIDMSKEPQDVRITFYISPDDPAKNMILWSFTYVDNNYYQIDMDDETGKILRIIAKRMTSETYKEEEIKSGIQSLADYLGVSITNVQFCEEKRNGYVTSKDMYKYNLVTLEEDGEEQRFVLYFNTLSTIFLFDDFYEKDDK